jgi:hypothetical protein
VFHTDAVSRNSSNILKAASLDEAFLSRLVQQQSKASSVTTKSKKKLTSLSAPAFTSRQSILTRGSSPQVSEEVSDRQTTLTSDDIELQHSFPSNDPSHPINRWLNSTEDPFAKAVERNIHDGAAFIIQLSNLESTMRKDTDNFTGLRDAFSLTMF